MMLRRLIGARIFFPPLGYCLFEALHEPAPRRTWGAVGPIDGRHRGHKALGRRLRSLGPASPLHGAPGFSHRVRQ